MLGLNVDVQLPAIAHGPVPRLVLGMQGQEASGAKQHTLSSYKLVCLLYSKLSWCHIFLGGQSYFFRWILVGIPPPLLFSVNPQRIVCQSSFLETSYLIKKFPGSGFSLRIARWMVLSFAGVLQFPFLFFYFFDGNSSNFLSLMKVKLLPMGFRLYSLYKEWRPK